MDKLHAVADVIRANGFGAMAREYIERPADRSRIVTIVARFIARDLGDERAQRFIEIAN